MIAWSNAVAPLPKYFNRKAGHFMSLQAGLKGEAFTTVTEKNTAVAVGSGLLPVFATPSMCALMEKAACAAVATALQDGEGSVGISLNITHSRATALNDTVTATAVLTEISGRKLTFTVTAEDSRGIIGQGSHERFIINNEKFMAKLQEK